jgi:anti-sigma regulatory factor (Ser/Thr protein kinase)
VTDRHSLTLRNATAEIARMATWADGVTGALGLPRRTAYALQLCLEEAVVNIISHALEPDTGHEIGIALWREPAVLQAEVTDDGPPFDPLAHAVPPRPKDIQSAPIGGLGIKLMRSFADAIAYRRSDGKNVLTLSFHIAPKMPKETGGPQGPEPTRYGDWEVNGRCTDF